MNEQDKEIKLPEEDDFTPPYLPYQRMIKRDDGTILIIMYD